MKISIVVSGISGISNLEHHIQKENTRTDFGIADIL